MELDQFTSQASQLAVLVLNQEVKNETAQENVALESLEAVELQDAEHLGWGPKLQILVQTVSTLHKN
jgi:hypothetical protein